MPKLSPVEASLRTIARRQAYPGASAASAQRAGTLCATFPAQAGTAAPKRCGCCKSYTRIERRLKCSSGKAAVRQRSAWTGKR